MPVSPVEVFANFAAAGGAPVNAAETVVATTKPVSGPYAGAGYLIEFAGQLTPGTSTTSVVIRIRRDSLTGTQVAISPLLTVVAAAPIALTFAATDLTLGDVAGQLWVVTMLQTAGAANGATANVVTKVSTPV